jgi:signal peptidase I
MYVSLPDEPSENPEEVTPRARKSRRQAVEWAAVILVAVLASFLIRVYAFQTFEVPSGSMLPTLQVGDRLVVDKLPWLAHSIHRGDIIVFHRAPHDTDLQYPILVKRVIGLPGETISSKGDTIYINGHPIAEPWLAALNTTLMCPQSNFGITPTRIKPGQYFVMGDCRGNSSDSRYWGTVPAKNIIGRVFLVIWRHNHPWFHWF